MKDMFRTYIEIQDICLVSDSSDYSCSDTKAIILLERYIKYCSSNSYETFEVLINLYKMG